jgi:hypothetical protein
MSGRCPLMVQSGRAVMLRSCPLSGVKRTSRSESAAAAYDPKRTCSASFDQLVGTGEDRLRNRKPKCLGGLEIDHQFVRALKAFSRAVKPGSSQRQTLMFTNPEQCPLLGARRTSRQSGIVSANDPKRTFIPNICRGGRASVPALIHNYWT